MNLFNFKGFAGISLEAELLGLADDPAVLLLHDIGESRGFWDQSAVALSMAGRQVINIDMRDQGASDAHDNGFGAHVADLRAVLGQLQKRPVIIAHGQSCAIAIAALGEDAVKLAVGLVLLEPTFLSEMDIFGNAERISLPALVLRYHRQETSPEANENSLFSGFPDVEFSELQTNAEAGSVQSTDTLNAALLDFLERKHPRSAIEFRSGSDARTLRDALGCFATGVTIVTATDSEGTPIGLTANSFTSVSLDPPLLLVCIANNASSAEALRMSDNFAINVLQIGQQPTSNRFASKAEDRFANTPWSVGEYGAPTLDGSLSIFECSKHALYDGGDHFILVGNVLKASFEPHRDPLLYFRGKYRLLHFT
jgi:flavin reductase (DIM6/NTAB) family NADH-FMN oxidoreductase RutF